MRLKKLYVFNAFILASSVLSISQVRAEPAEKTYNNLDLFQRVLFYIQKNSIEDVKERVLIEGAINGMLSTLDPHSGFLNEELYKEMKNDTAGRFGGVGIEIGVRNGQVTIITPMEDTPAWKAGVQAGDRIIKINGESAKGFTLFEAVSKMKGKRGSVLRISVARGDAGVVKDFSLVRETIKIKAVKSEMLEPGFGLLRLTTFNEESGRDLRIALENFEKKGPMKGVILDLRNNPGGLLDQAVEVCSLFLEDQVIVITRGRNPKDEEIRRSRKGIARKDLPVVVLVNAGSASASEIVAGALQDHKRAAILGQTTFGKGSVQSVVDVGPNLGLKLTIARYFTPSGRSIHEKGVTPDLVLEEVDSKILKDDKKTDEPVIREKDLVRRSKNISEDEKVGEDAVVKTKFDFGVQQGLNALKSFEIFRGLSQPVGHERPSDNKTSVR